MVVILLLDRAEQRCIGGRRFDNDRCFRCVVIINDQVHAVQVEEAGNSFLRCGRILGRGTGRDQSDQLIKTIKKMTADAAKEFRHTVTREACTYSLKGSIDKQADGALVMLCELLSEVRHQAHAAATDTRQLFSVLLPGLSDLDGAVHRDRIRVNELLELLDSIGFLIDDRKDLGPHIARLLLELTDGEAFGTDPFVELGDHGLFAFLESLNDGLPLCLKLILLEELCNTTAQELHRVAHHRCEYPSLATVKAQ